MREELERALSNWEDPATCTYDCIYDPSPPDPKYCYECATKHILSLFEDKVRGIDVEKTFDENIPEEWRSVMMRTRMVGAVAALWYCNGANAFRTALLKEIKGKEG